MPLIPLPARFRYHLWQLWELHPEVRAMRRHLARRLGPHDVVELGCGFGDNAPRCQGAYLGLDLDRELLAEAARRHGSPHRRFAEHRQGAAEPAHTALLCLVLHEAKQREVLLHQAQQLALNRVLIYDFDPDLRGLSRLRVSLLEEPVISDYWGFDPAALLAKQGWTTSGGGNLRQRLRWWEFGH